MVFLDSLIASRGFFVTLFAGIVDSGKLVSYIWWQITITLILIAQFHFCALFINNQVKTVLLGTFSWAIWPGADLSLGSPWARFVPKMCSVSLSRKGELGNCTEKAIVH